LFFCLAVTSIIGTIIEQQKDPDQYLREYGETTYKIFKFLGFTDVYHSWWYILLLTLLAINITVCSIKRLPKIWKVVKEPKKIFPEGAEKNLKVVHKITLRGNVNEIKEAVVQSLNKLRYKTEISKEENGEVHIFADKNVFARLGVYIVHLGVLVVLIGGLITAIFGYRGYILLFKGSSSNIVNFFSNEGKVVELPFTVKCNDFRIDFYPSGMPKAYISDVSIIENGKEVLRKKVKVNDPLEYKGIYFYQATYGQPAGIFFSLFDEKRKHLGDFAVPLSQAVKVKDGVYLRVVGFDPHTLAIGIEVINRGSLKSLTLTPVDFAQKMFPVYHLKDEKVYFILTNIMDGFYTGLQVAKDPGTWIVWVGSTILIIGLFVAFFVPHRRIWARVKESKEEKVTLVIGGITNKGTEGLVKELEEVLGVVKSSYCPNTPKEDKDA